jgi:DNA-binding PadR family transcriptional regulator
VKAGTRYAVLGLLLEQPSYGYEVLVRFRRAFEAGRWAVTPQGLYASLDRLERDGLIEPVEQRDPTASRRQPKTPYRVTSAGARELRRFLDRPMAAEPSRAELLVRLQCAASHDAAGLLRALAGYERACLEELDRIGDETGADPPHTRSLAERLTLEDRRLALQARLTWIDYARRELREVANEDRAERVAS